ncbi:MAG: YitT family protein [Clostridia bacterium]
MQDRAKKEKLLKEVKNDKTGKKEIVVNKKRGIEILKEAFFIIVGTFIISVGINLFLLPHKMTTGGVTGIGTILFYVMNIPVGLTLLVLNIPLFIVGVKKLGLKFTMKTMVATTLLSIFLEVFKYDSVIATQSLDLFTSCVFGGLLSGFGLSLVFKTGASTGGSDLLAQIIYKTTSVQSLSQTLMIIEIIIITGIILVFRDINLGLYSLISMFISMKIVDIMFEGIFYTKVVNIITKHPEKLVDAILNDLKRGATITKGIGAHSGEESTTITCIITRPQIAKLKSIVRQQDTDALMYITTSNEVIGEGFKSI